VTVTEKLLPSSTHKLASSEERGGSLLPIALLNGTRSGRNWDLPEGKTLQRGQGRAAKAQMPSGSLGSGNTKLCKASAEAVSLRSGNGSLGTVHLLTAPAAQPKNDREKGSVLPEHGLMPVGLRSSRHVLSS